jgi:hypothetical protein
MRFPSFILKSGRHLRADEMARVRDAFGAFRRGEGPIVLPPGLSIAWPREEPHAIADGLLAAYRLDRDAALAREHSPEAEDCGDRADGHQDNPNHAVPAGSVFQHASDPAYAIDVVPAAEGVVEPFAEANEAGAQPDGCEVAALKGQRADRKSDAGDDRAFVPLLNVQDPAEVGHR